MGKMWHNVLTITGWVCVALLLTTSSSMAATPALTSSRASPPLFIENVGQFEAPVRFRTVGESHTLWVTEQALWLTLRSPIEQDSHDLISLNGVLPDGVLSDGVLPDGVLPDGVYAQAPLGGQAAHIKISFPDAQTRAVHLEPLDRLSTRVSYFQGTDPAGWRTDVPVWGGVRYAGLAPGIDMEISNAGWQLVGAPAEGRSLRLRVEGADAVSLFNGQLRLHTAAGAYTLPLPVSGNSNIRQPQQQLTGEQAIEITIPLDTVVRSTAHSGNDDHSATTGDTPLMAYATYLGGYVYDQGRALAVDDDGNAYVVGTTESPDFPTTPGVVGEFYHGGDYDVFVAKLNRDGGRLIFATFLGGVEDDWGNDYGYGVDVDARRQVYVTGWTDSRTLYIICILR